MGSGPERWDKRAPRVVPEASRSVGVGWRRHSSFPDEGCTVNTEPGWLEEKGLVFYFTTVFLS